jgi:putative PIN family toxin of toxin-antitoxin system
MDGKVNLFVSPAVMEELRDVAGRPKVVTRLQLTVERTEEYLDVIQATASVLVDIREAFVYERDPEDARYVNLAVAAGADVIVSRDKDLLDLMNPTNPQGAEFRKRFPNIRILDPVSFLREIDETG